MGVEVSWPSAELVPCPALPEIRAICAEYGLEYTTGPLWRQYLQVLKKINRLALA
jgi:hypothetical protein